MDYIKSVALSYPTAPAIAIERRVNFSDYAPDGFGTADCLLLAGDVLHVIDYKHGKGVVVDAAENPQMKLYALGAMRDYAMLYQFKMVKMAIVQPRVGNISEFEMSADALLDWGKTVVRPKAQDSSAPASIAASAVRSMRAGHAASISLRSRSLRRHALIRGF